MTHGMNRLSAFGFSSFKGIDCTIPSGYFAIIILLMNRVSEKQIDKNSGKNGELQRWRERKTEVKIMNEFHWPSSISKS